MIMLTESLHFVLCMSVHNQLCTTVPTVYMHMQIKQLRMGCG